MTDPAFVASILAALCLNCAVLHGIPHVIDGDTVRIDQTTVRLKGVDAPERGTPDGDRSTVHMRAIVGTAPLTCAITGEKTRDREVGWCVTRDGVDINREIVRSGHALACPRYDPRYLEFEHPTSRPRARYCIPKHRTP